MDGQGKHVFVTLKRVETENTVSVEQEATTLEWTQERIDQRVKDEMRHWEKIAERAENPKQAEGVIPFYDQIRILRKGHKPDIDAMNATLDAAVQQGKASANNIRASIPAKASEVRNKLK